MDRPVEKTRRVTARRLALAAGLGLALLVAAFLLPSFRSWMRSEATVDASRIRVGRVVRGNVVRDVAVQGSIVAAFRPTLVSPAEGVASVRAKAGQSVNADDVLLQVSSPELANRLEQERSALASLQADLERQRIQAKQALAQRDQEIGLLEVELEATRRAMVRAEKIRAEGLLNAVEYEQARDNVQIAELRLETARSNAKFEDETLRFETRDRSSRVERQRLVTRELERRLRELDIRAPVPGLVSRVEVNDGDSVRAGQPLVVIVDLSEFEVEVAVPESYADELATGTPAVVDYSGESYQGAVKSISPEVEGNRVLAIVAFVDEPPAGLKQNQRVTTRLVFDTKVDTLKVQRGPFLEAGGGRSAYLIEDNLATLQPIEIGVLSIAEVEILGGLQEEDEIIISDTNKFEGAESVLLRR